MSSILDNQRNPTTCNHCTTENVSTVVVFLLKLKENPPTKGERRYNKNYKGFKNVDVDTYYTKPSNTKIFHQNSNFYIFPQDELERQYNLSKDKYQQMLIKYNVSMIPCNHYMYFYKRVGNLHIGSKWIPMGENFENTIDRIYNTLTEFGIIYTTKYFIMVS
jgi:hypothetical protein